MTRRCNIPTYVYTCPECGTEFDKYRVPMEDREFQVCPKCGTRGHIIIQPVPHYWNNFVNKGTQGGKGFTSITYPQDEYNRRVKTNAGKDDVYGKDFE